MTDDVQGGKERMNAYQHVFDLDDRVLWHGKPARVAWVSRKKIKIEFSDRSERWVPIVDLRPVPENVQAR